MKFFLNIVNSLVEWGFSHCTDRNLGIWYFSILLIMYFVFTVQLHLRMDYLPPVNSGLYESCLFIIDWSIPKNL